MYMALRKGWVRFRVKVRRVRIMPCIMVRVWVRLRVWIRVRFRLRL